MNLTVRQIELFVALMRNPHIGKVAEEHFITQSAVSMSLKQLEDIVGEKLFDRLRNRLVPNENGKQLYEKLSSVLERLTEAETLFSRDRMTGILTVGASSTIADYIMPQVLYEFRERFPEVRIEMASSNSAEVLTGIENGTISLGFIEGDYECPVAHFQKLYTEELTVVTSDRAFAAEREYTMRELTGHRWILREHGSGTRKVMWQKLGSLQNSLNVFLELDHLESIKMVLKNPGTLSCMSPFCFQRELANGELYPVQLKDTRFPRKLYAVTHKQKYVSSLLKAFIDAMTTHLHTMPQLSLTSR